ncbi:hypothetical protein SSS_04196, partial [Sarcoptes scabiei]
MIVVVDGRTEAEVGKHWMMMTHLNFNNQTSSNKKTKEKISKRWDRIGDECSDVVGRKKVRQSGGDFSFVDKCYYIHQKQLWIRLFFLCLVFQKEKIKIKKFLLAI